MELTEWKPFREVSRLRQEMDRLWEEYFGPSRRALRPLEAEWAPSVDVSESADKVTVKAEIPGMEPKDIDISLSGDLLTIKGEKKQEKETKDKNYHKIERSYGCFERSFTLPENADAENINANAENGVLEVVIPKVKESAKEAKKIAESIARTHPHIKTVFEKKSDRFGEFRLRELKPVIGKFPTKVFFSILQYFSELFSLIYNVFEVFKL